MKTKFILPLVTLCSIFFVHCKKYDAFGNEIKTFSEIKNANWLIGKWQHQTDSTTIAENWIQENDSTLTATSYFVQQNKDTLHHQTIELVQNDNQLRYYATIIGENNNEPIPFQKTTEANNELVFENPKSNYPQKIVYKKVATSKLLITISGTVKGKINTESYSLTKFK